MMQNSNVNGMNIGSALIRPLKGLCTNPITRRFQSLGKRDLSGSSNYLIKSFRFFMVPHYSTKFHLVAWIWYGIAIKPTFCIEEESRWNDIL